MILSWIMSALWLYGLALMPLIKWHGSTVRQTLRWAYETVMLNSSEILSTQLNSAFSSVSKLYGSTNVKNDAFSCKGLRRCPFDLTSYRIPCFCGLPWSYRPPKPFDPASRLLSFHPTLQMQAPKAYHQYALCRLVNGSMGLADEVWLVLTVWICPVQSYLGRWSWRMFFSHWFSMGPNHRLQDTRRWYTMPHCWLHQKACIPVVLRPRTTY